jgi:hypothetical protein
MADAAGIFGIIRSATGPVAHSFLFLCGRVAPLFSNFVEAKAIKDAPKETSKAVAKERRYGRVGSRESESESHAHRHRPP